MIRAGAILVRSPGTKELSSLSPRWWARTTTPTTMTSRRLVLLRGFSSSSSTSDGDKEAELVTTDLDPSTGVATVTMRRPPVNSLSLEM